MSDISAFIEKKLIRTHILLRNEKGKKLRKQNSQKRKREKTK